MFALARFSSLLLLLPALVNIAGAKTLVSYSAARGDQTSVLGLDNQGGWDNAVWPSTQGWNKSVDFSTAKDPSGKPAAHVHKDSHFTRAEYHVLKGQTQKDTTYYIGYHVRWDAVDYQTIVHQWKNYDEGTVGKSNIPIGMVFRADPDKKQNHTLEVGAIPDPSTGQGGTVWSKTLKMGTEYRFGLVINTSQTAGYMQLYFDGKIQTLTDPVSSKSVGQKLNGNFYPGKGNTDPKCGLYGGKNNLADDSYIYEYVVGTELADIKAAAGIN